MPTSRIRQIRPISGGCYGYPSHDNSPTNKAKTPGRHLRTTVRECLRRVRIARLAGLC
ncbi:hypothetical protein YT1_2932 [Rhodococcus ruber]|nr:hypothetical protein YT1_2932 [Rhodococcus ruber]